MNVKTVTWRKLGRFITAAKWIPRYETADFLRDLLAGVFVATLLIPQSMAYALLADLPPQVGLYASIVPVFIYALLGTSRFLSIGPVALISLLVGETIAQANISGNIAATEAALILAAIVGVLLVILGALRLGFLVSFISDPVLTGFTTAAAILIGGSQLSNLVGMPVARSSNLYGTVTQLAANIDKVNLTAVAIGGATLFILIMAGTPLERWMQKRGFKKRQRIFLSKGIPLGLVLSSTLLVWVFALDERAGVAVIGEIGKGVPPLRLPPFEPAVWVALLPGGVAIALIIFVTATAVAKSLAGRRREHIEPSQESITLGFANLAASLTGGYPAGASISRSAVNFDTGAKTPASTAVAAILVLFVGIFLGSFLQFLPKTVLAALIISAIFSLIDIQTIKRIWRTSRAEGLTFAITLLAVLFQGIEKGLIIGAVSGLTLYLWRTSRPRIVVEGRLNDSANFRSAEREAVESELSPVLVLRIDQSLYFANAGYCEDQVLRHVAENKAVYHLLIDFKSVDEIDVSGTRMLERLVTNLAEAGVTVNVAELKRPVQALLEEAGLLDRLGPEHVFVTADEALKVLKTRPERKEEVNPHGKV